MKCRYIESVSNTSITVTTSRSGVVSLGCSLCFDGRIVLFAVCTQDDSESLRWVTLWTRTEDDGPIEVNPLLDSIHPSLDRLDSQVIENIAHFVCNELESSEVELDKAYPNIEEEDEDLPIHVKNML